MPATHFKGDSTPDQPYLLQTRIQCAYELKRFAASATGTRHALLISFRGAVASPSDFMQQALKFWGLSKWIPSLPPPTP